MSESASHCSLSFDYPEGSLYEDVITKRIWMLQTTITSLHGLVVLTPYETTKTGELMEISAAVFIASKRFKRVHSEALVITNEGVFIRMDEEMFQMTFGDMDAYPVAEEAKSLGTVINFTPRSSNGNTPERVYDPSMDYNPLIRVGEMKDRLKEVIRCHKNILVESEALLATLTDFERDFKAQLDLPVSDS